MNPNQDSKQLLSEVIKKQIVILGPDITLAKARNVPGLIVADDGTVTDLSGDPQQITQTLIDQFVQLSGEIVRKTMEPLLTMNKTSQTPPPPQSAALAGAPAPQNIPSQPAQTPSLSQQPVQTPPLPLSPAAPTSQQPAPPPPSTDSTNSLQANSGQVPVAPETKPVQ